MKSRTLFLYALAYLAFLYGPVLVLPVFSFNDSQFIAFPLSGFTIRWYQGLAADSAMQHALGNSLKVGLATALLSTMLGLAAARAVTRYRLKGAGAALGFISLPLFIPDIVLGLSLMLLLGAGGLSLSLAAVVLGHLLICVPFALTVLIARFEGFDRNLEEASADLGEDPWMTFWRVTFPLMRPGVAAGMFYAFIVSFGDVPIAIFLVQSERTTLPVLIFQDMQFDFRPSMLAASIIVVIASLALILAVQRFAGLDVILPSKRK